MLSDQELELRKPIWLALSELWLDTELMESDLDHIASVMSQSRYSLDELRDIYLYEVAPVVYRNLLSVAGEWAGFDKEWLYGEMRRELRRTNSARRFRHRLLRPLMTYATERHWQVLAEKVVDRRRTPP